MSNANNVDKILNVFYQATQRTKSAVRVAVNRRAAKEKLQALVKECLPEEKHICVVNTHYPCAGCEVAIITQNLKKKGLLK